MAGRIDVRVLVLLLYLAEAHDQVTVSSLFSGHRLNARPGVISAHIYGLAVDIAALEGTSILGNSRPGGITEKAVRKLDQLSRRFRGIPRARSSPERRAVTAFPSAVRTDPLFVSSPRSARHR